jgi:hypothetical protein
VWNTVSTHTKKLKKGLTLLLYKANNGSDTSFWTAEDASLQETSKPSG